MASVLTLVLVLTVEKGPIALLVVAFLMIVMGKAALKVKFVWEPLVSQILVLQQVVQLSKVAWMDDVLKTVMRSSAPKELLARMEFVPMTPVFV